MLLITFLLIAFINNFCTNSDKSTDESGSIIKANIKNIYTPISQTPESSLIGTKGREIWVRRNELIILKPKGFKKEDVLNAINEELNSKGIKVNNLTILKYCDECDDKVILLGGEGIENYVFTLSPGGGDSCPNPNQPCQPQGKDNLVLTANSDSIQIKTIPNPTPAEFPKSEKTLIVAILDTGINPSDDCFRNNTNYFYTTSDGKVKGIDVVNNLPDFNDWSGSVPSSSGETDGQFHGTKVTKIILSQIRDTENVKIIPIKVTNGCPGQLYDALCGLFTAQKYKADIINISWGYLANDDVYRLTKKIFNYLKSEKVTIVAAAGNDDVNLDEIQNRRYPACFKDSLNNIYSVTSAKILRPGLLIAAENMSVSGQFIDVGVVCDTNNDFKIPDCENRVGFVRNYGTSYATAFFTGYLCKKGLVHSTKIDVLNQITNVRVENMPDKVINPN